LLRRYEDRAGHPLYLLEDAAYRELRFHGQDVKSALGAAGHAERVIYTGTYSKPFATGTRVGFGLLPKELFTPRKLF
jgi:2-aminoadipate transaminase